MNDEHLRRLIIFQIGKRCQGREAFAFGIHFFTWQRRHRLARLLSDKERIAMHSLAEIWRHDVGTRRIRRSAPTTMRTQTNEVEQKKYAPALAKPFCSPWARYSRARAVPGPLGLLFPHTCGKGA